MNTNERAVQRRKNTILELVESMRAAQLWPLNPPPAENNEPHVVVRHHKNIGVWKGGCL